MRRLRDKVGAKLVSIGRSISSRENSPIRPTHGTVGYTQPETQVFHMDDVNSPVRPSAWSRRSMSNSSSSSSLSEISRSDSGYHSPSARSSSIGSSYDGEPPSPPAGPYHSPVYGLSPRGSGMSRPSTSALDSPPFTFGKRSPLPISTGDAPSWASDMAAAARQVGETEVFSCELSPPLTDFGEKLDPFGSSSPVSPLGSLGYDCGSEQSTAGGSHVEQEDRWGGHGSPDLSSDLDHPRSFSDDPSTGYRSATGSSSSIAIPGQGSPTSLEWGSRGATSAPISIFH